MPELRRKAPQERERFLGREGADLELFLGGRREHLDTEDRESRVHDDASLLPVAQQHVSFTRFWSEEALEFVFRASSVARVEPCGDGKEDGFWRRTRKDVLAQLDALEDACREDVYGQHLYGDSWRVVISRPDRQSS